MKIKNLQLTTSLLILSTILCNAQSRENKVTVQFSSKSEKLTEATGWAQNKETEKWIENKNVINDRDCPSDWVSHISQNFKWIQFATILNSGQKYYVFLYERLGGEYKNPNMQENWEADKRTYFLIQTSTEYENLEQKIDLKSAENIKVTSKMSGYITDKNEILGGEHVYNEENLLAKITNTIEKPGYLATCFILNSQVVDGQEIVRFRLPGSCYLAEDHMKTTYFEVKTTAFKTILTE
jgi:hypothetical protein